MSGAGERFAKYALYAIMWFPIAFVGCFHVLVWLCASVWVYVCVAVGVCVCETNIQEKPIFECQFAPKALRWEEEGERR